MQSCNAVLMTTEMAGYRMRLRHSRDLGRIIYNVKSLVFLGRLSTSLSFVVYFYTNFWGLFCPGFSLE